MKLFQKKQSQSIGTAKVDSELHDKAEKQFMEEGQAHKHISTPRCKTEDMAVEERIRAAEQRRMEGNAFFKDGKLGEALQQYEKAIAYIGDDIMVQLSVKHREMALAVKNPCHLNMAASLLKLKRYEEAIVQCNIVLTRDENNGKALFRRGKAKAELGKSADAREDFLKARKLAPEDNAITNELSLLGEAGKISLEESQHAKAHRKDMAVEERLEAADQRKMEGNAFFKDEKLREAMQQYEKAIAYMGDDFMVHLSGRYREMALAVKNPCHLNMAACLLKLKRYEEAIKQCSIVLVQDENSVKALFRRGKARAELGRTDAARQDFLKARKLAPEDKAVAKEIHLLAEHEKAVYQKQKELYKGIFGPRIESDGLTKQDDTLLESISFAPKLNLTKRVSRVKIDAYNDHW